MTYYNGEKKAAVRAKVAGIIAAHKVGDVFESEYLAGLIHQHHECRTKPVQFRKTAGKRDDGYSLAAYFPGIGWHPISWMKAITPRTPEAIIKEALRLAIAPTIASYRTGHRYCELCGMAGGIEVDHVEPEFDEIAEAAIKAGDINQSMAHYDFWVKAPFMLKPGDKILTAFMKAHMSAKLRAVCTRCHLKSAADRRLARSASK